MKKFINKLKSSKAKTKRFSKPLPKESDVNNTTAKHSKPRFKLSNIIKSQTSNHEELNSQKPTKPLFTEHTSNDKPSAGHNYETSNTPTLKKRRKLSLNFNKRINLYLLLMIFLYIIIEVVFNYLLVHQMSYSATALDIQNIERAGKVVTGFGIALLMCKSLLNHAHVKFKFFIKSFIIFLIIGITLSFYLQTAIVNYVVGNATPEQQQRALLISTATTTLVPFYDDESESNHIKFTERLLFPFYKAISSESHYHPIQTKYQRVEHFHQASSACSPKAVNTYADHYPINNSLNKAFFAYSHLIALDTYEDLHKQAITNYFSCLFDDDVLVGMYTDHLQFIEDKVSEFYEEYLEKSEEYNTKLKEHPKYKDRIQSRWQSGTEDILGFESTLPPNLDYNEFVKHPDVKTYMTSNQTINLPYPYADDMSTELKNSLPDLVLVNYLMAKEEGIPEDITEDTEDESTTGDEDNDLSEITDLFKETSLTTAKKSYKAVVMPIIALGFSVTFLVLNVISMLSLILSNNSKRLSTWFQTIATGVFFVLPFVLSPPTPLSMPPNDSMFFTIIIEFLYFYQNIVWSIQQFIVGIF